MVKTKKQCCVFNVQWFWTTVTLLQAVTIQIVLALLRNSNNSRDLFKQTKPAGLWCTISLVIFFMLNIRMGNIYLWKLLAKFILHPKMNITKTYSCKNSGMNRSTKLPPVPFWHYWYFFYHTLELTFKSGWLFIVAMQRILTYSSVVQQLLNWLQVRESGCD